MKLLVCVRHPIHDNHRRLTAESALQMKNLHRKLKPLVRQAGGGAIVLSSSVPHVFGGAQMLAGHFGTTVHEHDAFCSRDGTCVKPKSILDILRLNDGFGAVIVVTDRELSGFVPSIYAMAELDTTAVSPIYINQGWARVIRMGLEKAPGFECFDLIGDVVEPTPLELAAEQSALAPRAAAAAS